MHMSRSRVVATLTPLVLAGMVRAAVPVVERSSVSISQDADSALVTVGYRLTGADAVITVDIQTNAGDNAWASIGWAHQRHWAGDVNKLVEADGEVVRTATWNAEADWPGFRLTGRARAVVKAWPRSSPPDYMVVDLTAPSNVLFYAAAEALPFGGVTNDLYKGEKLVMRRIRAANVTWAMGSPKSELGRSVEYDETIQYVRLTEDYYIGVYPVTQRQFLRVLNKRNPSHFFDGPKNWFRPVECVAWEGATGWQWVRGGDWIADGHDKVHADSFMAALRNRSGLMFDLPTSAQWEFACRAGTTSALYDGSNPTYTTTDGVTWSAETDAIGWNYHNNREDPDFAGNDEGFGTHVVGLKPANPWGLYDMLGNVWELCLDWYERTRVVTDDVLVDPKGAAVQGAKSEYSGHVWRGGSSSLDKNGAYLRSAAYYSYGTPSSRFQCTGFRLACPVWAGGIGPVSKAGGEE